MHVSTICMAGHSKIDSMAWQLLVCLDRPACAEGPFGDGWCAACPPEEAPYLHGRQNVGLEALEWMCFTPALVSRPSHSNGSYAAFWRLACGVLRFCDESAHMDAFLLH